MLVVSGPFDVLTRPYISPLYRDRELVYPYDLHDTGRSDVNYQFMLQ